jgi:4-amino-4-deoxychorismate lyase
MVLTHTTTHTYSHPFPTVTLAYFLRYSSPKLNPFSTHVLSTDTISSYIDPDTGRLHTTRVHLKKSRLPSAIFKLLPSSMTGLGAGNDRASYILETTVVDIKDGWMRTESRNLNFTGILSVVERQTYSLPQTIPPSGSSNSSKEVESSSTDVTTSVVYKSRLGERLRGRRGQTQGQSTPDEPRRLPAWMTGWGTKGIQRSIESIASTKTQDQLGKSREGMRYVLERLRNTGTMGVMEMMRRERKIA